MYLDHYHLKAKPFDLSPGPRFLWLGEKHEEALATLNYGILEDLGFLLLTGDVGVGKTALIHRLITNLDSSTIVAHITDPGLGILDFFKLLAVEFNIDSGFHSKGEFLIELEKFLHKAYSDHKKVLLIVDEAQRLSGKLLDQIRVLSNIELSDRKLINIFFVGQPEFIKLLMTDSSRAIRQRIAIKYQINPLTESETGQYIEHRLKVAGATHKIFQPNAIREIFRFTDGFPRSINVICDHALLTGYASGVNTIDSAVIEECEQELKIRAGFELSRTDYQKPTASKRPDTSQPASPRSASMGYLIVIGLFMVLTALASYYLLWPGPRWTIKPATQTPSKNESTPTLPYKGNATREKAAPIDEIASADRPTAIVTTPAKPAPGSLPNNREVDSGAITSGKTEKKLASPSGPSDAELQIQTEKATQTAEIGTQAVSTTKEKIVPSDRQPAIFTAQASPAPDPLPTISEVDNGVTVPAKAETDASAVAVLPEAKPEPKEDPPGINNPVTAAGKAAAAVVAVLADAKPEPKTLPPPRKEAAAPDVTPVRDADTGVDSPAAVPAAKTAPSPTPTTGTPGVKSDTTTPGTVGANAAAVAVLADVKPSSPVKPGTSVGNASGKPATNVQKPGHTKDPRAIESESQATVSPSKATAEVTTPAEDVQSGNRLEASLSAKAEAAPQSSSEVRGNTTASVEPLDVNGLENRLRSFLQTYCNTYAAKDLDGFTNFFSANAMENGKSFYSLVPKYERNFKLIETIQYRIELQGFSVAESEQIIKIDGDFFLKWLSPDKQWRENSGQISMSLIENGSSFLVQRLDYQGGGAKKK